MKTVTKVMIALGAIAFMALSSCLACFGQRNPAQQFYRDTLLPVLKAQHVRNFTVKGYDTWIKCSLP